MATRAAAPYRHNFIPPVDLRLENLVTPPTFDANKRGHVLIDGNGLIRVNNGTLYVALRDTATAIVDGDIAANAAIALSKLAVDPLARANHTGTQLANTISNFDAAAVAANASAISTASTADRNRANHTGTQAASTISDLATVVKAYRLNEFAAPNAAVSFGNQRLTNVADPSAATDAATKQYVDTAIQGLSKTTARVATTANITLSGLLTIDGITVAAGDRVLVKNQTNAAQNGVYAAASGTWTRVPDMDAPAEFDGSMVIIQDGGQAGTIWVTVSNVTTVGTSNVDWTQFGVASDFTAGAGLQRVGNEFSIASLAVVAGMIAAGAIDNTKLANNAVRTAHILDANVTAAKLASGAVDLTSAVVTGTLPVAKGGTGATTASGARTNIGAIGKYSNGATHSAGSTITITATTHQLGSGRDKNVTLIQEATGDVYDADVNIAANGDVTITFAASQSANTWRVVIMG